jgi:dolichyldiphosphatase
MSLGQTLSEILNFFIKRHIKEERPPGMPGKNSYGMPSSHAQFAFFFSTYCALFLLLRHRPSSTTVTPSGDFERVFVAVAGIATAGAVAASRVYLGYHTSKQVMVGGAAGVTMAVFWYVVVGYLRSSGLVSNLLDMDLLKQWRIRDLLPEEDFADAGWARWQSRRAKLGKKE